MSAKEYNMLKNVKEEKTNKTIIIKEVTKDWILCFLSSVDGKKFSLEKNFFITTSPN